MQMYKNILGIIVSLGFVLFVAFLIFPRYQINLGIIVPDSFSYALWESRSLDVLLQTLIILAGSIGILVLVKEKK